MARPGEDDIPYPGGPSTTPERTCEPGFFWDGSMCVAERPGQEPAGSSEPPCGPGEGRLVPGGPCVGGSSAPAGNPTGGGGAYAGYQTPQFTGGGFRFPNVTPPAFNAPKFSYGDFVAPKPEDIYNDPSYQWRVDQGRKALERSAASRGVLRSGGTLQGILEYGQNFGSQELNNVFNRAQSTYTTNRQTALDVFDRLYQGAKDEYAPKLLGFQTNVENERIARQREWEDFWRRQDDLWRRENAVLQAGQG